MSILERKIPPFIYRKSSLTILVAFTAIFALIFINIYEPFNSSQWYEISRFEYFLYSSLLILTGVMVVVIARTFMYFYTKKNTLAYWEYGIWILAEIFFMSLFYTMISYTLDERRVFWDVFESSIKNTSLVLLLPYTIVHLFLIIQEKNRQLSCIKEESNQETEKKGDIITFYDDKGEMKLSIKKESLLYIESADNYVSIWYLGKMGVTHFLLRNTLKNIEDRFSCTNMIRCHRSFIVNCDQVKVAKRVKNGIVLDFGIDKVPDIPVSKSYGDKVTEWFLSTMN